MNIPMEINERVEALPVNSSGKGWLTWNWGFRGWFAG